MKELRMEFIGKGEVKGFIFQQVFVNDNWYIYKVTNEGSTHFETFKRKINKFYNCVSYPTSKSFGVWAWCDTTLEKSKIRVAKYGI